MIRAGLLAAALALAPVLAFADARLTQLIDVLNLDAYVEITRQEGLRDAPDLAESFLGTAPDPVLLQQFDDIYDVQRMRETVRMALDERLSAENTEAALIFAGSALGQKIVSLELAARRAMMDPEIEEAAREAWRDAPEERPALVARIEEVIDVSDLIERNVTGALNSNLRFMQGMADGGDTDIATRDMLADIAAQEAAIRSDTETWLGAYLLLALQPLSEGEIETYIAFWETGAGRALNSAIFAAFNQVYDGVSYATGRVIAMRFGSEEL